MYILCTLVVSVLLLSLPLWVAVVLVLVGMLMSCLMPASQMHSGHLNFEDIYTCSARAGQA